MRTVASVSYKRFHKGAGPLKATRCLWSIGTSKSPAHSTQPVRGQDVHRRQGCWRDWLNRRGLSRNTHRRQTVHLQRNIIKVPKPKRTKVATMLKTARGIKSHDAKARQESFS